MKLSISITPESVYEFGAAQVVAGHYATEEEMATNPNKGWSGYVQDLIKRDMLQSRTDPAKPKRRRPDKLRHEQ